MNSHDLSRGRDLLLELLASRPQCHACARRGDRRLATRGPGLVCDEHATAEDAEERYSDGAAWREADDWRSRIDAPEHVAASLDEIQFGARETWCQDCGISHAPGRHQPPRVRS